VATLTFLFTDIEGSTRLWEAHPEAMRSALVTHDELITKAVETHEGRVFKHTGDGVAAVFGRAADGLAAAADAQRAMLATPHPDVGVLRIRAAVHSGEADERDGDFFGQPLNRVSRLLSAAHGSQVLVSLVTEQLCGANLPPGLSLVDLGEHRLRDLARPERVFQLTAADLPSDFPTLVTPDLVPNNLPTLTTSFVGRDQELAEIDKLIRGARLVTITGVGGAGKTRLALQAAAQFGDEFPGGVWLVELAGISDPDLVTSATAAAVGVAEQAGRSLQASLVDHLKGRTALVIMDNCEHVIGSSAALVDAILAGAPDCKVVATSRELLGLGGEVAFGMRSMSVPQAGARLDVSEVSRYDSVRLFAERAAASRPDFRMGADNAGAVIEICRRLDGMPLALELAAARLRSFSPQQIADLLDQRFRLLTGGSRTALPRQQTLAAAIDWSYQLLEPNERLLFERLAVFQGGFTLEAAQQVCADADLDAFDVLELIPSLVDKSLVAADPGAEAVRYRLLETVRQYARDLLDQHGAADAFRRRHADFFVGLAEAAEPHVRGAEERLWWDRIDAELDNLRQAMLWSLEVGETEKAMRIAGAIWRFWWFKVRFSEGTSWLQRALAEETDVPKHVRAKALLGLGSLLGFVDSAGTSTDYLERALVLYRELDTEGADPALLRHGYPAALINLTAQASLTEAAKERNRALNQEALEVAERIGDPAGVAVALGNLAEIDAHDGNHEAARQGFRASIAASEKLGSAYRAGEAHLQLGMFELSASRPDLALQALSGALHHAERGGLQEWAALTRTHITIARHDAGDTEGALTEFARDAAAALENEDMRRFVWVHAGWLVERADLELAAGDPEVAGVLLGGLRVLDPEDTYLDWTYFPRRDRVLAGVTAALGEQGAASAMGRGAALDPEAILDLITREPDTE